MYRVLTKRMGGPSFGKDTKGVAAIEFAILMPIFVMLFAGVVNFGYLIFAQHSMQNVAGDALRSIVYGNEQAADAAKGAQNDLKGINGTFSVSVTENPTTSNVTVSIVADTKSVTPIGIPFVSPDILIKKIRVEVTSPRIAQFNPIRST